MIAHQEADISGRRLELHGGVQHTGAVRAAVDQITEKDDLAFRVAALGIILDDLLQQLLQKVVAAMDIPDRIDPPPFRDGGGVNRSGRFSFS